MSAEKLLSHKARQHQISQNLSPIQSVWEALQILLPVAVFDRSLQLTSRFIQDFDLFLATLVQPVYLSPTYITTNTVPNQL